MCGSRESFQKSREERGRSLGPDLEVDVDGEVNLEGGDFLDNRDGAEDIDDSLVDAHLISVPGVGTLTARRLSGGDSQDLGRDSSGAANFITLVRLEGTGDDLRAGSLERLHMSALESESTKQ